MNEPKTETKKTMRWEFALPTPVALEAVKADAPVLDADAFAGFYERAARPLWAYLARTCSNPALAEDLMQESFVHFLTSERVQDLALQGEVAARRYLFRIASNLLRDHWRHPRTEALEESPEEPFSLIGGEATSDAQMLLGPALRQLRPRDRQLLWLAYAEGYTHKEIAEVTGLASASVRLLLFRARRKMAHLIEGTERNRRQA